MTKKDHTSIVATVADTIERHHIFDTKNVLVALSGGADSVALLRMLLELGYSCTAAHCNFQLRGAESVRDEEFVRDMCQRLGIALEATRFDTKLYATQHGLSIEMAARQLRYSFFDDILNRRGLDCVAVAHHRDDNAETLLLNMVRGTGIKGLTGMAYRRDNVARPLLDISRQDILSYLGAIGQDHVNDSTNEVADVKRNIVRLKLLPILRQLNPAIEETLVANASHLKEVYDYTLSQMPQLHATSHNDTMVIQKRDIDCHLALFIMLEGKGFTPSQVNDIWHRLDQAPGAIYSSDTHQLLRDRDSIIIRKKDANPNHIGITTRYADIAQYHSVPRNKETACLDADKVGDYFTLRRAKPGDRFVPLGMKGSKLVSDFLTDHKVNLFDKQNQMVLVNRHDIVWLVGQRIDDRYKVVEGQTRRLLICKLKENKQQ